MPYIGFGLVGIILGLILAHGSDSPIMLERSELLGWILVAGGAIAVLIGMVTHVVQVTRADRRGP